MDIRYLIISFTLLLSFYSCNNEKIPKHNIGVFNTGKQNDTSYKVDLEDIQRNGEIIILTLYGPNSYFLYRGEEYGEQFYLAKQYARHIGVSTRIDISRDEKEMFRKLQDGEGDIVAYNIPIDKERNAEITYCGTEELTTFFDSLEKEKGIKETSASKIAWCVRTSSSSLEKSLSDWLSINKNNLYNLTRPTITYNREKGKFTRKYTPRITTNAPILNEASGIISKYDYLFKKHAMKCGWDWRLIAAQCYTESSFDKNAVSWMGAMGLMQLMPQTASDMGISERNIFDPETNVRGGINLIAKLDKYYSKISDSNERIKFILGAYNAGPGHIDDAIRLAAKNGYNPNIWHDNVEKYVLLMSHSEYYNDPIVKNGYFRGEETSNYVRRIFSRWDDYKAKIRQ